MNLIIDIGNTAIKVAFFYENGEIVVRPFLIDQLKECIEYISSKSYLKAIVSSVNDEKTTHEIIKNVKNAIVLTAEIKLPFTNLYATPQTLGKDRIANAAAATAMFPNQNCLVVDCGTCLKYDFITANGDYLGGAIAPGLTMRFKALHNFTANLPLLEVFDSNQPLIGNSTNASMQSGCTNGMKNELIKTIEEYEKTYSSLKIVLTGGESHFFETIALSEKNSIFADSMFTLKGLNTILNYNA